jgi:hypothetical protein
MKNVFKAKKDILKQTGKKKYLLLAFAVLLFSLFATSYSETAEIQKKIKQKQNKTYKAEIEADGYKYRYEAVPRLLPEDPKEIFFDSKITIRGADGTVFYQETTSLDYRMCGKFPVLSKLPFKVPNHIPIEGDIQKWLVVVCGDYGGGGRHVMLKIFFKDLILKSTTLHFESTTPNLSDIDGDGFYEAQVYRRVLFPETKSGLQSYLTVYKLRIDDTLFSFIPVFGPDLAKPYLDYYIWQKETLNRRIKNEAMSDEDKKIFFNVNAGQILAALIATQDKQKICEEIKTFHTYGLSNQDLQAWTKRIKSLGYPDFDINTCKEVSK